MSVCPQAGRGASAPQGWESWPAGAPAGTPREAGRSCPRARDWVQALGLCWAVLGSGGFPYLLTEWPRSRQLARPPQPSSLSAPSPSHRLQTLPAAGWQAWSQSPSLRQPPSSQAPPRLTLSPLSSIRQYGLVVHPDIDPAKVYMGEVGRLKSYENQKP